MQSKYLAVVTSLLIFAACNNAEKKTTVREIRLKEETVNYKIDSLSMSSYVVYDENKEGIRPAVLVIHEWWGLNDYAKRRARQLTELGYIAMAVDMYGNKRLADNPELAEKLSTPFYYNPAMAKNHFDAALLKLKAFKQVDTSNIAAIGYCFGGSQVINIANLGEDLKAVICFHGNVIAGTEIDKKLLKAKVLVCNGAADEFVPLAEINIFKRKMDSIGAAYTIKLYPGAKHAFTNPEATAIGKKFNLPIEYNAAGDTASWNEMKNFFQRIFK